jgi:GTP-binding protein
MLTGPEAGITRESVEVEWEYKGNKIKLIDTAGLRKRANVQYSLEKMSTGDAIGSIKFANTVILMLDATIALEHQDLTIANYVIDQGRSLVIAVNKWDLIRKKNEYKEEFEYKLSTLLPQVKNVPAIYLSAADNIKTAEVLDGCIEIYKLWNKKIPTSKLNDWLSFTIERHPLPIHKKLGRRVRIKYLTQIKSRPPTFKFFTNDPASITEAYKKYLLNSLRSDFDMPGVPIRFHFSKSDNPYAKKK